MNVESTGAFEAMDEGQLLAAWQEICGGDFPGRELAIPRMLATLAERPTPKGALPPKKKHPKKKRGRPHVPFDLQPKPGPKRLPRPNTRRDKALILCLRGATVEQVMSSTGSTMKQAYNDVRLLHFDLGYGIREDANGRITVFE